MHMLKAATLTFLSAALLCAQTNTSDKPTWWNKYQVLQSGIDKKSPTGTSITVGANVDASNECGPQSETYIAINPSAPTTLAGGSNEIFRLPMRGYFSSDGGSTWGGVDLPLPAAIGTNGTRFGSDPSLAFDSSGNLYYSYIVVFFSNGNGINGTEMAVAKSTDGGKTYPSVSFFAFESGSNHFNDKPMITTDANAGSRFRNRVYVAWDAASGGSTGGGIRVASSADGTNFTVTRADDPGGPGRAIGAVPFVGPGGELYVAWNDYAANTIAFNRSFDGGQTWDRQRVVATKRIPFDIAVPAESFRGALVYPSCAADTSTGPQRGRLYCSWMDLTASGTTDILVSYSSDQGLSWTAPQHVTDQLFAPVDRFNHWLSADPVTGDVNVSFYDTRNDITGSRYMTDIYLSQSTNGAASWSLPNTRVSTVSSNEHDCGGVFPCSAIDYGNQQGDYAGLASYGGVSHPIWTDSRLQLNASSSCRTNLAMEEVFTAKVGGSKSGK
jgi:hypothetical protein